MRSIYSLVVVALALLLPASLHAQPPTTTQQAEAPPPAAGELREPETFTRPPEPLREDVPDEPPEQEPAVTFGKNPISIKMGDFTLTPLLEARFRPEVRANVYGNGVQLAKSLHFVTSRVRLGLDGQWKFLRVMMQIQDARLFGTRPGFDDGGSFALHQGILEFGNDDRGYVRVGRQEINYGNQRMIGALDWLMGARSFDALRLHGFFGDKVEVDAFGSMLARQQDFIVDDTVTPPVTEQNNGSYLAAINAIYKHSAKLRMEGYVLYRHDRPFAAVPLAPRNDIISPGVFVTGVPVDGLKYTGELTMQGGKQVGQAFFAFAVSGDVEYTFDAKWKPTLYGGFAYASGNEQGEKLGEFNNFFPTNHKFYGAADLFGLRNLIDGHLAVGVTTPNSPVGLKLELLNMALADPSARWSQAGGLTLGQNAANTTRNLGQEIDALFKWRFVQWASLSGGYTVFIPNQGARNLGHDIATHWAYAMITLRTP
jgi:hypothetical protein